MQPGLLRIEKKGRELLVPPNCPSGVLHSHLIILVPPSLGYGQADERAPIGLFEFANFPIGRQVFTRHQNGPR